ncbi:hypothetical protein Ddc_12319 [Ditylenchus destructor]|nr:hypothetical protein Ddc_12319 [Ditylenchus destructor]
MESIASRPPSLWHFMPRGIMPQALTCQSRANQVVPSGLGDIMQAMPPRRLSPLYYFRRVSRDRLSLFSACSSGFSTTNVLLNAFLCQCPYKANAVEASPNKGFALQPAGWLRLGRRTFHQPHSLCRPRPLWLWTSNAFR